MTSFALILDEGKEAVHVSGSQVSISSPSR